MIHHEFEHTRFGRNSSNNADTLEEEIFAVRNMENAVRGLNGYEPRYTYTKMRGPEDPESTVSIKNPTNEQKGGWGFCMNDITKLRQLE